MDQTSRIKAASVGRALSQLLKVNPKLPTDLVGRLSRYEDPSFVEALRLRPRAKQVPVNELLSGLMSRSPVTPADASSAVRTLFRQQGYNKRAFQLPGLIKTIGAQIPRSWSGAKSVLNRQTWNELAPSLGRALANDAPLAGHIGLSSLRGSVAPMAQAAKKPALMGFGVGTGVDAAAQSLDDKPGIDMGRLLTAGVIGSGAGGAMGGGHALLKRVGNTKNLLTSGLHMGGYSKFKPLLEDAVSRPGNARNMVPELWKAWRELDPRKYEVGKLINSPGSRGTIGPQVVSSLKNLGVRHLDTGMIVNPNVALALNNPRMMKKLNEAGIRRLSGYLESRGLRRLKPGEVEEALRLRRSGVRITDPKVREMLYQYDEQSDAGSKLRGVFMGGSSSPFDLHTAIAKGLPLDILQ